MTVPFVYVTRISYQNAEVELPRLKDEVHVKASRVKIRILHDVAGSDTGQRSRAELAVVAGATAGYSVWAKIAAIQFGRNARRLPTANPETVQVFTSAEYFAPTPWKASVHAINA